MIKVHRHGAALELSKEQLENFAMEVFLRRAVQIKLILEQLPTMTEQQIAELLESHELLSIDR